MCASSYVPNAIYKDTIVIPQRMAAAGQRRLSFYVVFFILEYVTKGGNTMGLFGKKSLFKLSFTNIFSSKLPKSSDYLLEYQHFLLNQILKIF